ncbi:uncharacterized protein LACBIDRAFT_328387 [Laccaria bicolor S238N-H82]|uniref:Predicted protein n=1 Tax=Laccaria bicolor (strain S238N-H82 / ATCC MYA-4686) TaxID=486041 RepID=B0DEQ4_LACBS|nr:uncharacterized protein LACBIDRAFT_328387 [Laccaria bicolor S238N-H82]EDR07068.1 predicted protein [Laccaria bicolor S238N-H82]|eukprot:XP_001882441.1 predicted protein [Laccaria bicolor S238N-H82]
MNAWTRHAQPCDKTQHEQSLAYHHEPNAAPVFGLFDVSLLVVPFEIRHIPAQNGWEDCSPETETTAQARKRHRPLDLDHDDGDGDARGKGKNRAVIGDAHSLSFHPGPQTTLPHFSELRSGSDVRIPPANPDQWPRFPKIPAPSKHAGKVWCRSAVDRSLILSVTDRSKSHFEVLDFRNTSKDENSWISWLPGSDEAGGPSPSDSCQLNTSSDDTLNSQGKQKGARRRGMPQKKRDLHQKKVNLHPIFPHDPRPLFDALKTLLDLENQVALSLHRGAGNCSINLSGLPSIPPQTNYEETNGDNPSNHAVPDAGAQGSVLQTRMRLNPIRFREPLTAASRSDRRVYRGGVAIVQQWGGEVTIQTLQQGGLLF